jgi:uncharacterized protein YlxP (DUF503 family)
VTVGIYTIEIHLPGSRSLKDKRQIVRRLKDRMRARHNVSVAEIGDHAGLWQRGGLMLVSVAADRDALERRFESLYRLAVELVPGSVIEAGREYIDGAEHPGGDWEEDA